MSIKQSAKKARRSSLRKRGRNLKRKEDYKKAIKSYRQLIKSGRLDEARESLPSVQRILDKIAKTGVIKKNKASRLKSRLAKKLIAQK